MVRGCSPFARSAHAPIATLLAQAAWLGTHGPSVCLLQVSARTGEGVSEAVAAIRRERRGRDVYVIGAANVGKSAFIRALVRQVSGDARPGSRRPQGNVQGIHLCLQNGWQLAARLPVPNISAGGWAGTPGWAPHGLQHANTTHPSRP